MIEDQGCVLMGQDQIDHDASVPVAATGARGCFSAVEWDDQDQESSDAVRPSPSHREALP